MLDQNPEVLERRAKLANDDFSREDLHDYVKERSNPDGKVHILKKGRWIRINEYQLFLRKQSSNWDFAWIHVVVRPHKPLLNWILLPIARLRAEKQEVVVDWWSTIPGTNLLLDIWFVGDGNGSASLVVEKK